MIHQMSSGGYGRGFSPEVSLSYPLVVRKYTLSAYEIKLISSEKFSGVFAGTVLFNLRWRRVCGLISQIFGEIILGIQWKFQFIQIKEDKDGQRDHNEENEEDRPAEGKMRAGFAI